MVSVRDMGGAPRNPAPRKHFLAWIVKPPSCHCTDAFGKKNIVECRPLLGALPPSLMTRHAATQATRPPLPRCRRGGNPAPDSARPARSRDRGVRKRARVGLPGRTFTEQDTLSRHSVPGCQKEGCRRNMLLGVSPAHGAASIPNTARFRNFKPLKMHPDPGGLILLELVEGLRRGP